MGHFAQDDPGAGTERAWDSITLRRFLRQLPAGVEVVHDAGDRPLRWVEPSDMDDPTDYLMDDELILTSGYPLVEHAADQQWVDQFVARLVQANVSALGFGLEPYFNQIPPTVADACQRLGLTLLQIPASLPFAAVGLAFARLMEADGAALLRATADANRALMRCLGHPNPEEELVSVLAQRTGATVRLCGAGARVRYLARSATVPEPGAEQIGELFAAAAQGSGQQLGLSNDRGAAHLAFPLRAAAPARGSAPLLGVLLASFAAAPTALERSLITTALGLLELVARQRNTGAFASTQLAASLLLDPGAQLQPDQLGWLASCLGGNPRAPLRVAVLSGPEDAGEERRGAQLTHLRTLLSSSLVLHRGGRFTALTRAEPGAALFARLAQSGYLAAFSEPAAPDREAATALHRLQAQAEGLIPQVLEAGRSLDAARLPRSFAALLPESAGRQLGEQMLGGVLALPAARRALYLKVLRAWLDANGSWDQTAKAIALHRNSVRRHIAAIGELLELDLQQASVRSELYLALRFTAGG